MALTIAEADAMIETAERAGRLLRVIDNYRFHPPFVRARQIIESGGIGDPMSVRIKTASGTAPSGLGDSPIVPRVAAPIRPCRAKAPSSSITATTSGR